MVDYTAEQGWLAITLKIQLLMQSVIQARWFDESEFLTLPHVNHANLDLFYNIENDYEYLTLPALKDLCRKEYEKLAKPLRDMFEESEIEQIYKVISIFLLCFLILYFNFICVSIGFTRSTRDLSAFSN